MTISGSIALLSAVAMKGQKGAQIVFGDPHDTAGPMRDEIRRDRSSVELCDPKPLKLRLQFR